MPCRRLVIAGTHSGVGKTTATLALAGVLRQRGFVVQPFKVGPDFIDPGHHSKVCGRLCRNLDSWMLSPQDLELGFFRASVGADISLVEGAMGLFDGRSDDQGRGSTAEVAHLIQAPVILIVDASSVSRSIAAVIKGFSEFDPSIRIRGVICNRVAGLRHYQSIAPAICRHTNVVPLGWLPRDSEWQIPERHLGLITADDFSAPEAFANKLADTFKRMVDVEKLLELSEVEPLPVPSIPPRRLLSSSKRVAVARDQAFCFYYPENLELLEEAGGKVEYFSPLNDSSLPPHSDLLYLGGGYPELHAESLALNDSMKHSIRKFSNGGGTIYAECGGLMYLCRELVDVSGQVFPMVDLVPARTTMQQRLARLGYLTLETTRQSPLGPVGVVARGHEFHYSRLEEFGPVTYASRAHMAKKKWHRDGIVNGNLYAGYAHLHFGSNPTIAEELLKSR